MGDRITTRVAAEGRWRDILPHFGIPLKVLDGRHHPCPACGGRDRFRFDDRTKNGDYYCNGCGAGQGIKLLMQVKGWSYGIAAQEVDKILRTNWRVSMSPENRPPPEEIRIPKSVRDCAFWIRKCHPQRLDAWLERHDIEVRWWLESQA